MTGPRIRTDVIDVYLFRRAPAGVELLQLRRASTPLRGTWQPIMGHCENEETACDAAWRELEEEVGLSRADPALRDVWALEGVHPFYIARSDTVMLTPRFAVEAAPDWIPRLNEEHDAFRWTTLGNAERDFLWPGQHSAVAELARSIVPDHAPQRALLRVPRP